MTQELRNVVLIGASGTTGAIILQSLLASDDVEVTILTRSSSTATFPPQVKAVIKSDYSEAQLVKAFRGHDAVVSAVGAMGLAGQTAFIDAAVKAGVKRFIPSEFSVNTLSSVVCELAPVFQVKRQVLDHLKSLESTGLTWTGLGAGLLFDWGLHSGFLGFDLVNKKATVWDGGETPFSVTNQLDLGNAVASILKRPAETANKYIYMATVTTTQKAILETLEAQSGKKWAVERVETEKQVATAREHLAGGNIMAGMFMLVQASAYGAVPGTRADYSVHETLANSDLGLPFGSVEDTVKSALKAHA